MAYMGRVLSACGMGGWKGRLKEIYRTTRGSFRAFWFLIGSLSAVGDYNAPLHLYAMDTRADPFTLTARLCRNEKWMLNDRLSSVIGRAETLSAYGFENYLTLLSNSGDAERASLVADWYSLSEYFCHFLGQS